jgi:hypothetical protein
MTEHSASITAWKTDVVAIKGEVVDDETGKNGQTIIGH